MESVGENPAMAWLREHSSLLIVVGIIAAMAWWMDDKIGDVADTQADIRERLAALEARWGDD